MSNMVQISDGSWQPVDYTNTCSICKEIKLLDDAKERGVNSIICFDCALEHNINHCRVCGKKIPLFGGSRERVKCSDCCTRNTAEQLLKKKEQRVLQKVLEEVEPEHYEVALILLALGDAQKGGFV